MNLAAIIGVKLKISLFLTALGFGLKAHPDQVFYLFRKPGLLLRSLTAMNLVMPIVAIIMVFTQDLPLLIKVALIAISVSPLAPLFPRKPLKAGGRENYVLGLMVAVSLFSVILVPVTLSLLDKIISRHVEISVLPVFFIILATVIGPLFLGIALNKYLPTFSEKAAYPVAWIAQVLLIIALLPILIKFLPEVFRLIGNGTVIPIAAYVIFGLLAGHFLGGPDKQDQIVLANATASRHPAIALTLANANLTDHHLAVPAILLYLLISLIVAFPYLKWMNRNKTQSPFEQEAK